jgi:hypothetical protein
MHDHRFISLYDLIIIDKTKIKENGLDISAEIDFVFKLTKKKFIEKFCLVRSKCFYSLLYLNQFWINLNLRNQVKFNVFWAAYLFLDWKSARHKTENNFDTTKKPAFCDVLVRFTFKKIYSIKHTFILINKNPNRYEALLVKKNKKGKKGKR